uniref:Zinc finger protein 638 n=1 Tax=Fundulus heteroclitus TaxID=8078 RepID=A0A3Q2PR61_FUNHE
MQRDPRRQPSLLGSGPSFGSPSVNRGPLGGPIPSLLSLPMNFRPEKKETAAEEDAGRRLDCHTGRAREEAVPNFASQNSQFTNVQRNTYPSSNRGRPSFLTAPPTQEKRPFTVDSGSSSPDWASAGESSNMYSSASSGFRSSAIPATGGLRDYETSLSDKTGPPAEAFNPKYTSESATNILLHFGLQREDLEHLTAYPEDQLTPENLPFILRQIRLEKAERTQTAAQGPVLDPGEIASQVLKTSKVIDYGHTSQSELSSFEPLDEDTDLRQLEPEAPKSVPLKKPAPAPQALSKANLIRGVHPGRPGLVLIGSNTASGLGQQPTLPQGFPATQLTPSLLIPNCPTPAMRGPNQRDARTGVGVSKQEPTPAMMQDYTAATPRIFPHTCCLCRKECSNLKVSIRLQIFLLHWKVSLERFDELDFSSGDFVTVDEVNEDMDVPGVEGHPSSSKLTPRDKKGMQSSAARKSSTGSASSSPKSAKGSQSLRSTPVSANKKKSSSEPKKSEAKGHKTCSTGQKAQSNKSEPSSSGQGSHSSETSIKLSVKDQQEKKEIEQAKSDHKAPVESSAANSVEAELNSDSSAKMDVPTEGQSLQETDLKDETVEETKSKENEKKSDTDGKSTDEERGDENKQLLHSLSRKSDEQQNKEDAQDETTVTQTPEVEQDQILHQGGVQVVESTDNNKAQSDECDEMEVSGKLQDGTKDQAAAADDGDEGPSRMEKDNSSEKQEMSVKKDEARTKEMKKGGKSLGDCLVVVYDVLDATKDDLIPKTSAAEGSGRRRSARGNKKQTPAPVEEPKSGNEEETLTALDSVEEESRSDKPVVTRSTRGRRENATKKVEENTKKREDKTPTRRQRTPARDSKEKDGEKTPKTDVLSDTVETDTSKETDGVQDDQPITQEPRRGRPKKDNKSKKQIEPKGESVRQSVDSLKDECQERESETTDEMAADVNNVNSLDQTPQAAFGKASPKTNDETAAAAIDDLMNQGELSPEELKKRQAAEKTENEQEDGRSMERETGEQRSQSGGDGGGSGEMVRDEEQNREDVETAKEAASESEILNEIGAKAESEAATQEGMITEEGPQELVAEKEEDQKEEQGALEAQPQIQESQPEVWLTNSFRFSFSQKKGQMFALISSCCVSFFFFFFFRVCQN